MGPKKILAGALALAWTGVGAEPPPNPYAGQQTRAIKALSEEEVRAYLQGEGMGLARAAELNRYPGPKHVLELADDLALTAGQRAAVQEAHARMREEALALGAAIVEEERALDAAFAAAAIDAGTLRARVSRIAGLQGQLRAAHLAAHLVTRDVLTAAQVERYVARRGYGGAHDGHHGGHHGPPAAPASPPPGR